MRTADKRALSQIFALAEARASEKLLAAQPKLRAKGAGRVIELLLSDDAVSPARAAKVARLPIAPPAVCSIG